MAIYILVWIYPPPIPFYPSSIANSISILIFSRYCWQEKRINERSILGGHPNHSRKKTPVLLKLNLKVKAPTKIRLLFFTAKSIACFPEAKPPRTVPPAGLSAGALAFANPTTRFCPFLRTPRTAGYARYTF